MTKRGGALVVAAVISAVLPSPGAAAADEPAAPGAVPIPKVEIVAIAPLHGLGIDRNLLPYQVQVADDTAIRKAGGENLSDFMSRNLSGVNVNDVSGSPFQKDVTFHGFRASPVLGSSQGMSVYLDGVRVNEPFGDVVNWDMLPEPAIGSVLLVPGANPLYGLNTLGGALAFTTRSGQTHPGGEAELSVSNEGQRRADLAYGVQGRDGWHSFVAATAFNDQGWREKSSGHLGNVFVKVGHAQGATDWSASLLGGRSHLLGNGLLPESLYQDNRRAVYTYPDTTRNRLVLGTLNLTHRPGAGSQLNVAVYARNSRRDTVNGDVSEDADNYAEDCGDGFSPEGASLEPPRCAPAREQGAAPHAGVLNTTQTRQESRGASAAFSARPGALRIDAGATFDHSTMDYAQYEQAAFITPDRGVAGDPAEPRTLSTGVSGSARTFGAYLAASAGLAPGAQLTASARYNRARVDNRLFDGDGLKPAERFTYSRVNPSLGITYQLERGVTLFANAAQGNRIPTVIELGCADPDNPCRLPVGLQSDPYLKQVIGRTLEAGARGRFKGGSYALSLHRTANRDDILFLSSPSRQGYFSNFERTRYQGLDATLARQAGPFDVRLSYSYLEAVYDADGELFTGARHVRVQRGTRIAGLPRHTGKLQLDWAVNPQLNLGLDLNAYSSLASQGNEDGLVRDPGDDAAPARAQWPVHGYALAGLRASYRPAARWELFARVSNLSNRRYETFGAVAADLFPHGQLVRPHEAQGEAMHSRFLAPGAPRTFVAGLRYTF